MSKIQYHECKEIGLTMAEAEVREVHNAHGQHYWIAIAQIGSVFGAEVEGELKGIGKTKEQALERLAEERKKLAESLWY